MTCAPGPDCEPYHNRQPVILEQDQWAPWLNLTADAGSILRAGSANTIAIERSAAVSARSHSPAKQKISDPALLKRHVVLSPFGPVHS